MARGVHHISSIGFGLVYEYGPSPRLQGGRLDKTKLFCVIGASYEAFLFRLLT